MKKNSAIIQLLIGLALFTSESRAGSNWDGGGITNLTSAAANWDLDALPGSGAALTFGSVSPIGTTIVWDFSASKNPNSITFPAGALGYTINEPTGLNFIQIVQGSGGGIFNNSSNTQTINNAVYVFFNGVKQFNAANSNLVFGKNVGFRTDSMTTGQINTISLTGNKNGTINGSIVNGNAPGTGVTYVLSKDGIGSWTLAGTNSFSGTTKITAGTLFMNGSLPGAVTVSGGTLAGNGTLTGAVAVASGGINAGASASSAGTLTIQNNLSLASGSTATFDLAGTNTPGGGVNDLIQLSGIAGNLTLNNNTATINPIATLAAGTPYTLITFTGTRSGALGAVSGLGRQTATVTYDDTPSAGKVMVTFGAASAQVGLIWNSTSSNIWDVQTTPNWLNAGSPDFFYQADNVTFDDTPGVQTNITLNTVVAPSAVSVNTSANAFSISGTGKISGGASLTKSGSSSLTVSNTNDYTGTTAINGGLLEFTGNNNVVDTSAIILNGGNMKFSGGGTRSNLISGAGNLTIAGTNLLTLSGNNSYSGVTTLAGGTLGISSLTNGGINSSIGAAPSSASNLVFAGGALSYSGGNASSDRNFTLQNAAVNSIAVTNAATTLTLTGSSPTNTGLLQKDGAGVLTLDPGVGSYSLASLEANGGTLTLKSGTFTTTGTDPTAAITGYAIGAGARNGGTLVVDGATLNVTGSGSLKPGAASTGNLNILSGTVNATSIILGHNGSTVANQNGGNVNATNFYHFDGGSASYTMTGGTLTVQNIYNYSSVVNTPFTFIMNGGTVRAAAGTTNLFANSGRVGPEVAVQLGSTGATIDTSLSNATIVRPLVDVPGQAGQLTKIGTNTLTLAATNTFTGPTTVSAGTLAVTGRITQTSSLLVNSNATLQIGLQASAGTPAVTVNGDVTLAGQISVSDLGIVANTTYPVISYTGQLTNNGITVTPGLSQWAFTIDTSVPGIVSLVVGQKYPLIQFTSTSSVVTSLTTDLSGILPGTLPVGSIWYEVRDQANKLWDFGATQARTPWSITVRHLRGGTNTVTVFAKEATGAIQSSSIQLTVNLGPNTGVRPRPIPSEIWWGGVADNSQMTNYSQWPFVQKYEDGFFFHSYYWTTTQMISSATASTLEQSLATNLLPFNTKYWVELAGFITAPSTTSAATQLASAGNAAAVCEANGIIWSEFTHDYHMENLQQLCQMNPTWPTNDQIAWWTGDLTIASGTYPYTSGIWRDVFNGYYARFPHIKVGHTSQPEYWPWDSYPGLISNDLPFSPQTAREVIGSFVNMATAIGHPYFSLQSDAPWDFFGGTKFDGSTWATAANQAVMRQKIRVYEQYLQSRDSRHTLICNVSDATRGRLGSFDAADAYYEDRSLSSMYLHQQEGGRANRYLHESWYPGKAPYAVVPETKVGSYTHLALSAIKYLKGIADINGNLEPLNITPTATNGTVVQLQLKNNGDVKCLPALAGQVGTVPGVSTRYFSTNGAEVTATVLTPEGLCYTNMLQPGATTNLFAVTLANGIAATTNDNASLEAFWNPQDPLGIVRDREVFATPVNPLGSWQDADIGSVGLTGGSALSGSNFTLLGSGADIADTADACHFVWQTKSGDTTLTAHVTSQTAADAWSKAGVMIRESTAADARNVFVCLTPANGASFQNRAASGGTSDSTSLAGMVAPYWVRLTRSGTTFTALCSSDGENWVTVGSADLTGFATSALWGLAVTAHNNALASAATFDNVTFPNNANTAPVLNPIANRTLIAGQTLTFTNVANDVDVPTQTLTFSLVAPPAGATVDNLSGVFNWRPTIAQAPAAYPVCVKITDNGTPPLSATQSFDVSVTEPAHPAVSSLSFGNGQFSMTIHGDSGPDYTIFASPNLIDWTPVRVANSPTLPFTFTDPDSANFKTRFYRVMLGP